MKIMKSIGVIGVIMGPSFYFGYIGNNVAMSISVIAGALAVALCDLEKFDFIKGGSFIAKIRAVNKAYATLERVKEISSILLSFSIDISTYNDRITGLPKECKEKYLQDIKHLVDTLELNDDTMILNAINRKHYIEAVDLFKKFIDDINKDTDNRFNGFLNTLLGERARVNQLPGREDVINIITNHSNCDDTIFVDFPNKFSENTISSWSMYMSMKKKYKN